MTVHPDGEGRPPRLAILSFSSGEYDARSFRLARSAIAAGYEVTMYARWHPGQPPVEELDGYRLVRADIDWRLAVPGLRRLARRRSAARMRAAALRHAASPGEAAPPRGAQQPERAVATPAGSGGETSWRRSPLLAPARLALRVQRKLRHWRSILFIFPLRPLGWAYALEPLVEPADVWHGMWAGSLPALNRLAARYGGRTIYDSRDVYMLSRDFARLEWPLKPLLVGLERRWAQRVDRVLTVNEAYADLIAAQLGVERPPVVRNCPERWDRPANAEDQLRAATGIDPGTAVVLYQGQLVTERGIEQAMDAILRVPDAALVLLGFGSKERAYRQMAASAPYAGRVFIVPAVPPSELLAWTSSADVMVMPIQPTTTNHRYTTPQKLWEAVAAGVPVVTSDLPGMAPVVEDAAIGVVCDPGSAASIAAAIRLVLERSPGEREALRRHVRHVAHDVYNWESQLGVLFGVYAALGHPPPVPLAAQDGQGAPAGDEALPAANLEPRGRGRRLRLASAGRAVLPGDDPDTILVVTDTAWTPTEDELATGPVLLRDVVEEIMRELDLYATASELLDTWAEATDMAGLLAHDGVSYWYGARLRHWTWLVDQILWLNAVDRLVTSTAGVRALEMDGAVDPDLWEAARCIAARHGLAFEGQAPARDGGLFARVGASGARAGEAERSGSGAHGGAPVPGTNGPLQRLRWRFVPPPAERRRRETLRRIRAIEHDRTRRLLVVQAHVRQRIETPAGSRLLNVYLGPVLERLRGSRLEPFQVDIRSGMDDIGWSRIADAPRTLPSDAIGMLARATRPNPVHRQVAAESATRIAALDVPLLVAGVDLGPTLARRIAERSASSLARQLAECARVREAIRRLHPAGILIADEYHRQDWLAAAGAEGVPVAAVQHGVIYRWHTGYVHRTRPAHLRLPGRTYVFGRWERDLLTKTSVYRPDEVVVGGSPRLDLVRPEPVDRAAVRAELGVADDHRLLVLSGTWGPLYRTFHYPIALARLFAGPLEQVHLVVKLHPTERDEGPYRRIIEGLAVAGGFEPPPITVVRDVDLYRLLAAADSHLGIHSTVLTEAVATGTPNLLATGVAGADLLGYLEAGVAIPVETTQDLRDALALPREQAMPEERRAAFLALHYEPGDASGRIADDLLAWLP